MHTTIPSNLQGTPWYPGTVQNEKGERNKEINRERSGPAHDVTSTAEQVQ
jgi:hypothetical protein